MVKNELLKNMKYLVDNSACSLKLKQKIFLDMKEIDRQLKERDEIKKKFFERKNNYIFLAYLYKLWEKENKLKGEVMNEG